MNKLAEAFSKTETGKTAIKNIEKTINNNLPVEKKTAALIGSTAATIAQGKIDTKHVKNINVKMFKGSVRPDAEYDFKEQNTSITLKYNLDF